MRQFADAMTIIAVADEVWAATAFLHLERPKASSFCLAEIIERARHSAHPGVECRAKNLFSRRSTPG
jgi:hypothetical protein